MADATFTLSNVEPELRIGETLTVQLGHFSGATIVRASGRNRHERRANEALRRRGLPPTMPDEIIWPRNG